MKLPIFPARKKDAHKGDNGKVLVVGGNELYHGAPILAALGAQRGGADLVYMYVPQSVVLPARCASNGLIVSGFRGEFLSIYDVKSILNRAHMCDTLVIGNGLGTNEETQEALAKILERAPCPVVLDAGALQPAYLEILPAGSVLTPHAHEFRRLFGCYAAQAMVGEFAQKIGRTIVCKGMIDLIGDPDGEVFQNKSGCAEMTVGGTGDVLAGVIGGFLARGINPRDAARLAVDWLGRTGEALARSRRGFSADELVDYLAEKK